MCILECINFFVCWRHARKCIRVGECFYTAPVEYVLQYANVTVEPVTYKQHCGAVEACWAHNPEVEGSKPSSAMMFNMLTVSSVDSLSTFLLNVSP